MVSLKPSGKCVCNDFIHFNSFDYASGPRVKLAGRKSALNPRVVYSTDRSKAVARC